MCNPPYKTSLDAPTSVHEGILLDNLLPMHLFLPQPNRFTFASEANTAFTIMLHLRYIKNINQDSKSERLDHGCKLNN